jgi:RNA polymerase sigma-70 factor (ECF subfamily)
MAITLAATFPSLAMPEAGAFLMSLVSNGRGREGVASRPAAIRTPAPEELLVHQARHGDENSFRLLVERHGGAAYALALRIVRSPQDAEEVAQDAFLRAWRALPQFRGESSFSTWLYRIVARRALGQAAVARRRMENEVSLDDRTVDAMPDPRPSRALDRTHLRLERLIADLPPMQRAVVTLFYLRDRSLRDVAEVLDLPAGTVKTHLHRSRAALRAAWLRESAGEERDELQGF